MTVDKAQRDAFGAALVELGAQNDRIVVLDADLGSSTKAAEFQKAYPERFFQIGIAEQNMIGIAAGLATMGFIPFANTFAAFASTRVTDQLRTSVAQPAYPVKLVGAYAGLLAGKTGKTHLSVIDTSVLRAMPNMTVVAPGDAVEAGKAVIAAAAHPGPVYLRLTRDPGPVVFDDDYDFVIGRAVTLRDGADVAIVTTGSMVARGLEAADALATDGIQATVLHVPTLKPLDEEAIVAAAERTGAVVTAEEHTIIGGLGGAVAETLGEQRPTPMRRVGIDDLWGESAPNADLLEKYGVTAAHIAAAARELVAAGMARD
jgi:transketolase